jgi:PET assembly of cytochrome c oxidase, mitochondrial
MSSRRAGMVLAGITATTIGVIVFVHFDQKWDKQRMYAGVLRDIEREKAKKDARKAGS